MKKIIVGLMILMGVTIFAEKLNTDGKNNLDKLQGTWSSGEIFIKKDKEQWILGFVDAEEGYIWGKISNYKQGALIRISPINRKNIFYFAWDTKYKSLVELDKDLNIRKVYRRKLNHPAG